MKVQNKGVLPASNVYFHTHSETASKLYFYPLCTGHYVCDSDYEVDRISYNSFLLVYVIRGSGYVVNRGSELSVPAGSIFLLNCYTPHRYGTREGWEILWVHFDGVMARAYFDAIAQGQDSVALTPPDPYTARRNLEKIYNMYHEKGKASEPIANKYITNALTDFLTHSAAAPTRSASVSEDLLTYITENLHLQLTLEELARRAALSPFYFTRQFKKETGYTPHQYLILTRVNAAKFHLKTTTMPIKEIAYRCGFSNEADFCTTFKRLEGVTPTAYRKSAG